ncbi:ATP-binding protein [Flavobacterium sp. JP2137]|uniref:ATP-binding protein n=1 Tax=Flavobacterium sp. JP2137 TaxID=3414510 RepID=UPI003D2FA911
MDNNQTIEKLKAMRLSDMALLHSRHLKDNTITSFTIDEYIALLTDHEYENRQNRKVERLIKQANFRQNASIADINYTHNRN